MKFLTTFAFANARKSHAAGNENGGVKDTITVTHL